MSDEYISIDAATKQYDAALQELHHMKWRTLVALLVSTILILEVSFVPILLGGLLWRFSETPYLRVSGIRYSLFLKGGLFINVLTWLIWCLPGYRSLLSIGRRRQALDESRDRLLMQYERTLYELRRQRLITSVIDLLIALQFVLVGFMMIFSISVSF